MADTHDNVPKIAKAVSFFNENKVDKVLHAGDFTSGFTFETLNNLNSDLVGIFGNNDGDVFTLNIVSCGKIRKQPYVFSIENKKTVMIHQPDLVFSLAKSKVYDIIIYGHTHKPDIRLEEQTLIINPGEVCGWRYNMSTVALLDTNTLEVKIIHLD